MGRPVSECVVRAGGADGVQDPLVTMVGGWRDGGRSTSMGLLTDGTSAHDGAPHLLLRSSSGVARQHRGDAVVDRATRAGETRWTAAHAVAHYRARTAQTVDLHALSDWNL